MEPFSLIAALSLLVAAVSSEPRGDARRGQQLMAWAEELRRFGIEKPEDVAVLMDMFIAKGAHQDGLPTTWFWANNEAVRAASWGDLVLLVWPSGPRSSGRAQVLGRHEDEYGEPTLRSGSIHDDDWVEGAVARALIAWRNEHPEVYQLRHEFLDDLEAVIGSWNRTHGSWFTLQPERVYDEVVIGT